MHSKVRLIYYVLHPNGSFMHFTAHKVAYTKCQLLHRDISGGNILIQSNGKGLLNDWDMAVKEEDLQNGPRAHERTVRLTGWSAPI